MQEHTYPFAILTYLESLGLVVARGWSVEATDLDVLGKLEVVTSLLRLAYTYLGSNASESMTGFLI